MSDQEHPDLGPESPDEPEGPRAPRASFSRRQQLRATRLEVGGVIGNTFSIWFGNFLPFSALALLIYSPILIITWVFFSGYPSAESIQQFTGIKGIAEFVFFSSLLTGTVTFGVVMQLRGSRAAVGRCLTIGLSRLLHVFAISLIVALMGILCFVPCVLFAFAGSAGLMMLLFFVAFIPLFVILTTYNVAVPAVVVERVGVGTALARSAGLTKGSRLTIFGIMILFGILILVITLVFEFLTGAMGSGWSVQTQVLVEAVFGVLLSPLTATFPAVIYHDLRVGKEGVNVEDLAAVFE
jgi:hypothetical protein